MESNGVNRKLYDNHVVCARHNAPWWFRLDFSKVILDYLEVGQMWPSFRQRIILFVVV